MSTKIKDSLEKLETVLERLREALSEDSANGLVIDATIQRFDFVFELAWKTLKRALNAEGISCQTPRETLKAAYKASWIENEEQLWLQMLDDRNLPPILITNRLPTIFMKTSEVIIMRSLNWLDLFGENIQACLTRNADILVCLSGNTTRARRQGMSMLRHAGSA